LWNPYISQGGSHIADPAALAAYVPAVLLFVLLPDTVAYNYTVLAHVWLAAAGMYLLARSWALSRGAGLAAAMAFGFSGFLVAHLQHLNIVIALAWIPWLWYFVERFLETRRVSLLVLGSLALGLQILGGHSQLVMYGGLALAGYLLLGFTRAWRAGERALILTQALGLTGMAIGGILLAAVYLVPFLELFAYSTRGASVTYEFATSFSLEPLRLVTFIYPFFWGGNPGSIESGPGSLIEMTAYVGIVTLALAGCALARRGWRLYFLIALAIVALVLAFGGYTPAYTLVYQLPLLGTARAPARFLALVVFALALLAGIGLDALQVGAARRVVAPIAIGLLILAAALGLMALAGQVQIGLPPNLAQAASNPALYAAFGFTCVAAFLLFSWQRSFFSARVRVILTLTLVFADLFYFGWNLRYNWVTAPIVYFEPSRNARAWMQDPSALAYYWGWGETKPASMLQRGDLAGYLLNARAGLRQSLPMQFQLRSLQGYGTEPTAYEELLHAIEARGEFDDESARLLAIYGDTFVLSPQPLESDELENAQRAGLVNLYRNTLGSNVGRAHLAWDAQYFSDEARMFAALVGSMPDPGLVRFVGSLPPREGPEQARGDVAIELSQPERVRVRVETNQPGWLVLNDTYFPGWSATVDADPAEIHRANALVRAVEVPAGSHIVEFVYDPLSFKVGAAISGITFLILVAILAVDLYRRRLGLPRPAPLSPHQAGRPPDA
jgi:hypothetical protein